LCIRRTLCRHLMIGALMVIFAFLMIGTLLVQLLVPTVNRQKQSRHSKQQKMTIGVPIVTCLHRVHLIHKVRIRVRRIHKAPIGSRTWAFQRTHPGTPKIQDGGDPPSWILTPKCKKRDFLKN